MTSKSPHVKQHENMAKGQLDLICLIVCLSDNYKKFIKDHISKHLDNKEFTW